MAPSASAKHKPAERVSLLLKIQHERAKPTRQTLPLPSALATRGFILLIRGCRSASRPDRISRRPELMRRNVCNRDSLTSRQRGVPRRPCHLARSFSSARRLARLAHREFPARPRASESDGVSYALVSLSRTLEVT